MQKINKWQKKTITHTQTMKQETEAICALQQEKEMHKEAYGRRTALVINGVQ